ncbi:MAG TPA: hypothetical protein VMI54_11785 [Polyangiaceae bacterium]|nr:hypothetical protein [Polyangiaceae bacterium]
MKTWVSLGVLVACVGLAYGCGDDDDDNGGGHAGAGGSAGTSGTTARGGTSGAGAAAHGGGGSSGRAGTSGRGGSSGRPDGGTSGRGSLTGGSSNAEGGAAGNAGGGAAGAAAVSGNAGGGAGGHAGSCDTEARPQKLSTTCEPVLTAEGTYQDTTTTDCTFESACAAAHCGTLWSAYDANMCRRPLCRSSDECGEGERCMAPPLLGDVTCYFDPEYPDGFSVASDCSCSFLPTECAPRAYCLPAADYPPENDCPVEHMSCDDLSVGYDAAFDWLSSLEIPDGSDLGSALASCQSKIQAALPACESGGGDGGGHSN